MGIVSSIATILVIGVFFGFLLLILYACSYPVYERLLWRYRNFRTDNLKSIVLLLGKDFTEKDIDNLTEELDSKVRVRTDGSVKKIRTITTSIGPDGICYITAWYKSNKPTHTEQSYNYYDMSQFKIS